jgi:hypothetical protein
LYVLNSTELRNSLLNLTATDHPNVSTFLITTYSGGRSFRRAANAPRRRPFLRATNPPLPDNPCHSFRLVLITPQIGWGLLARTFQLFKTVG